MATVAPPPADQAADLLQKLSLDSQTKTTLEPTKKTSGQIPSDRSVTPLSADFMDQSFSYLPNGYPSTAYYYGGYDGTPEGVDMTSGVYGDNGSLMYHHGYGYAPYGPYSPATSPAPTMGNDGQLYGPQHYQYPPYFQPLTPTSGPYTPSPVAPQNEVSTLAAEQKTLPVETAKVISNGIANNASVKASNGSAPLSTYQTATFNSHGSYGRGALPARVPTPGYQDPRYGYDTVRSPIPWLDAPLFSDGQHRPVANTPITSNSNGNRIPSLRSQNYRPNSHYMGLHHPRPLSGIGTAQGFMNSSMYPSKLFGQYGNAVRSGLGYGSHGYDSRSSGRTWLAVDNKYKQPRGRNGGYYGYGNENSDGLNELNRGPRARGSKNQKSFAPSAVALKGQNVPANLSNDEEKDPGTVPDREQYNKADFPEDYTDAKFFIIKSYSEDDVHKSIKYNVWASTPNGNKKLHVAYQEAQEGGFPVFLFFSVNTSGQFVGLAEMLGPVDFNKNLEYWQQDKWNGCFSVKWHIVKDVPNSLLKHITLENNENKPVTNSRDTQEVKLEPGLKMIKIFKEHLSKTCILDDFGFYESRQKTIQEKKAKQQQQFQKQVWEGKTLDEKKEVVTNGQVKTQNSLDVPSEISKESIPTVHASEELKLAENGSIATGEAPKGAKPVVAEKRVVANGVANGC